MRFMKDFFILVSLFITHTLAVSQAGIVTSVDGCNLSGLTANQGFSGTVYNHASAATGVYVDSNYYLSGYQTEKSLGTIVMSSLSFSVNGQTTSFSGVSIDSNDFVLAMTGYFYGMFFLIIYLLNYIFKFFYFL